jgi:transmembrane sensor
VTPGKKRSFRVLAGPYTVAVVGTVFTVAISPTEVSVQVERGAVRVPGRKGIGPVGAGDRVALPLAKAEPAAASEPSQEPAEPEQLEQAEVAREPAHVAPHRGATRPPQPSDPSWRQLAHQGQYAKAYERLQAEGPEAVHNDAGDLLLVADVARLSGHPSAAEAALRRVLRHHGGDARAPLAAFTLGRLLLNDYGRPADAARAFSRARQLAPRGVLAQDALAREVECRARAGQKELARSLAEQYRKTYPAGQRTKTVEHYGGL